MIPRQKSLRNLSICQSNECGNYRVGDRCKLFTRPCCIMTRLLRGEGCPMPEPRFAPIGHETPNVVDLDGFIANQCDQIDDVELVTCHFNVCRFQRLVETYKEWLPSLGPLSSRFKCYELVFDDDPSEIPGSIILKGTRNKNLMWQKEAIINIALSKCTKPYFAWIDHDLIFENQDWLTDGIRKLEQGAVAVQLFDRVARMSKSRTVERSTPGAVKQASIGERSGVNPGGAWIARTEYLNRVGGLNHENLFGGGDQTWLDGLLNHPSNHLNGYSPELAKSLRQWIAKAGSESHGMFPEYVPGTAYHLWHGTQENRQYSTRNKVLIDEDFDPLVDIRLDAQGLIEWASDKPRLHTGIATFFRRRRDDG